MHPKLPCGLQLSLACLARAGAEDGSVSFQLSASSQLGPSFAAEAFLPLGVLLFIGISPSQLEGEPHCVRLCTK